MANKQPDATSQHAACPPNSNAPFSSRPTTQSPNSASPLPLAKHTNSASHRITTFLVSVKQAQRFKFSSSWSISTKSNVAVTTLHATTTTCTLVHLYTLSNKNQAAWNFARPAPEVTWRTVAIVIRVILLSPYLCIRAVSLSLSHSLQSTTPPIH
jgi:hypothetical protein